MSKLSRFLIKRWRRIWWISCHVFWYSWLKMQYLIRLCNRFSWLEDLSNKRVARKTSRRPMYIVVDPQVKSYVIKFLRQSISHFRVSAKSGKSGKSQGIHFSPWKVWEKSGNFDKEYGKSQGNQEDFLRTANWKESIKIQ